MNRIEFLINEVAQSKIDFESGFQAILYEPNFDFQAVFMLLENYIFNSIPDKVSYKTETYQNAINSIPLKSTFAPVVILKNYSTKIAFAKLQKLPDSERNKVIISLLWIFKQTDTERRNTECKMGCGHEWHNIE